MRRVKSKGKVLVCHRLCEPRYQALAQIKKYLFDNGFEVEEGGPRRDGYDVALLIMCAFSNSFENFAFDWLDMLDPDKLVLTGCFPKIAERRLSRTYDTFDMMTDIGGIEKILRKRGFSVSPFSHDRHVESMISVTQGCNHHCAYCVSRQAIGPLKSKSLKEIQCNIDALSGSFEIAGDDLGSWGMDLGLDLSVLLETLDPNRVNWMSDINPWKFVEFSLEIHNFFAQSSTPIEIGVPIHSGSQRVLKLMNRSKTNLQEVAKALRPLKKLETITTRTSIIVGFPGETEEEFVNSIEYATSNFDRACFIEFSPRPNTSALSKSDQIPPEIIHSWIERHLNPYLKSDNSPYVYYDEPLLPDRWPRSEWNR